MRTIGAAVMRNEKFEATDGVCPWCRMTYHTFGCTFAMASFAIEWLGEKPYTKEEYDAALGRASDAFNAAKEEPK